MPAPYGIRGFGAFAAYPPTASKRAALPWRYATGAKVMGGMVAASVLGVLFVPVFYVVVQRLVGRRKKETA